MNLRSVKPGSHILCNVNGRAFTATVDSLTKSKWGRGTTVNITPDSPSVSYLHVSARQVKARLR